MVLEVEREKVVGEGVGGGLVTVVEMYVLGWGEGE